MAVAVGCEKKSVTGVAANYTLSLAPAALTIVQGGNGAATVTITRTNFTGAVTLSLGGAPAGVTGSFSPAAPMSTTSTLTLSVGAAVAPGVYDLTVDGTGTPGNRSTPLALTVVVAPDYGLSLTPAALTIVQGSNGTTTVNITRTNFTGAVTLSLGGNAPAGVTGSFNPAAPTGNSSTFTVSVGASVVPGVYTLPVDGTGAPGSRSTPLTLTVTAAPPDYTLSLAPAALAIGQGANAPTTVNISRTNFTDGVTLTLENAPTGVTGAFDPTPATGATSTLTVSVGAAVVTGTYALTVRGTATGLADQTATLTLTVTAAPAYTLSLNPAALTIGQGANAPTTVNITRTNFTGAVTLSLGGAPAGVTGSFNPAAPTGTSSTLTVSVAASATPGVYNLTVDGTGTAGNRSTPLTLTVEAAPDYTLSLSPAALTIAQGANAPTTVNISRTNFTGGVTLTLEGAPAGVTGAFNPTPATGATSTLTVSVGASVTAGTYTLTVRGTATGLTDRTAALTLTVTTTGGGGNVTLNYANCTAEERPVWVAYQDGTGPWTRVTGTGDVYTFTITNSRYGLAGVFLTTAPSSSVEVQYVTLAEFSGTVDLCPTITTPTTKSINGTVAGITGTNVANISLGGGSAFAFVGALDFVINGVLDGTHDLLALRRADGTAPPDAVIIRRDQNIPNNGTVGTLDFDGAEAFAPISATITVGGSPVGGEMLTESVTYHTGPSCLGSTLNFFSDGTASFTAYGIPPVRQRASDFHSVVIGGQSTNASRTVIEYFNAMGTRTVTLGAPLPMPTITSPPPPVLYKRLQAVYTLPADYQGFTSFGYDDQAGKSVSMFASFPYLGGQAVTLALPDFSALAGWDNNWAPASSSTVDWGTSAGSSFTGSSCTENARSAFATLSGTF